MSTEPPASQDPKRLLQFMILSLVLITGTNFLLSRFGLLPEPQEPEKPPVAKADATPKGAPDAPLPADGEGDAEAPAVAQSESEPSKPDAPEAPPVATVDDPERLALGSVDDPGYHLQVFTAQQGASVRRIRSSSHNAEFEDDKPRRRPLTLVDSVTTDHRPLAMQVLEEGDDGLLVPVDDLDGRLWQVLVDGAPLDELDEEARSKARPVAILRDDEGNEVGQEIRYRTTLDEADDLPPVVITRTYRLRKGADAVELEIDFTLPEGAAEGRELVYRLDGPSGIPVEGKWYTHTFRNAFFGKGGEGEDVEVWTYSAYDVAKNPDGDDYVNTALPTAFAGVENQYFATFLKPADPASQVAEAAMTVVDASQTELKEADVAVDFLSRPVEVEPGVAASHAYTLFAGPKTEEALVPFGAEELAIYRQVGKVPIIGFLFDMIWAVVDPIVALLSVWVIGPLLAGIYTMTATISGWFGGTRGSYGVAIILLTVVVRLALFPLSRKQAMSAKRMQDLQPQMMALREKYQDDREKIASETFALYRKHGINPLGGCLPVFVQIPIFMTLWRVLNVSVALRQAQFLWIDNLAAPDMLFKLPFELPMLGPYFNLLPLGVIGLFLLQMKLFTPPATTPEQETQQKIMKFMMVFMMLMFYRVPAGLALYFITSSIWSISERKLLPKVTKAPLALGDDGDEGSGPGPDGKGKGRGPDKGPDTGGGNGGGWLSRKLDGLMKEAAKETTYRREEIERRRKELERGPGAAPAEREGDRTRPRKKSKPGKRR